MAGVFDSEINEMLQSAEKKADRDKIIKALTSGSFEEANVLFKYSVLTAEEYKDIQDDLKRRKDQQ